jgi:serine/threonine-protein kinase
VSKGSETVTLESMKGWTEAEVDDYLTENDLVGDRHTGKSGAVSDGEVFRQDPPAGSDVKRGDTVSYWISTGQPQAAVPELVNLTQADAEAALADAGLSVGTVTTAPSTTVPAGSVISQDPAAGEKVDKGSRVSFVVSTGSPSPTATPTPTTSPSVTGVSVPNVLGMQSSVAEQELNALGLQVAYRQKPNTGQPTGTVVRVRPDTGTVVPSGTTVLLVIAS